MPIPTAPLLPLRRRNALRQRGVLVSRFSAMTLHGAYYVQARDERAHMALWRKPRRINLRWWSPGQRRAYAKIERRAMAALAMGDNVAVARALQAYGELWPVRVPRVY